MFNEDILPDLAVGGAFTDEDVQSVGRYIISNIEVINEQQLWL
jgi:hypothetical protein